MNSDPFYKVILEALVTDTEASLRMLSEIPCNLDGVETYEGVVPVKSSLRRAIRDAKSAMKGFEG